ncbi:MAG TPA: PIG-L family deacetylase [Thermoanaerobaculia bacterium]
MAKSTSVDAIFFAAHADDIELACGGTIAKMVRDGHGIGIVDLTRGSEISSRRWSGATCA